MYKNGLTSKSTWCIQKPPWTSTCTSRYLNILPKPVLGFLSQVMSVEVCLHRWEQFAQFYHCLQSLGDTWLMGCPRSKAWTLKDPNGSPGKGLNGSPCLQPWVKLLPVQSYFLLSLQIGDPTVDHHVLLGAEQTRGVTKVLRPRNCTTDWHLPYFLLWGCRERAWRQHLMTSQGSKIWLFANL